MSMNRETDLLLQSGIAAVRSGDKREGARLLAQVVRKEPQSEDAWFWLAAATDQPAEAAACLRRVLAINPNNERARQALSMLDTGQGQAAFNTGPLDTEPNGDSGNRPLSTGDLISPYNPPSPPVAVPVPAPPPPPAPPFGSNPYGNEPTVTSAPPFGNDPYGNEATVATAPPPFAWTPNSNGEMPADPYSVNTVPSAGPVQSNLPPPPPFTGGSGVRLGQLDPNAPVVQNNPNLAGPPVFDPGAELRASLLPTMPVNAVPPPPGQVIVVKKRRRLNPLFLVLAALIVLLLAALIAFLLLQNKSTDQVADVSSANQTATVAVALTATSTAQGTPGAINGTNGATGGTTNGTPGVGTGNGTPGNGANGTSGTSNGTPGNAANGTGSANGNTGGTPGVRVGNGTPGVGTGNGTSGAGTGNGTSGNAANGTAGGTGNGTPGANGTTGTGVNGTGTLPAGTVRPGQPTLTAQPGNSQPGNNTGTGTNPAPTPINATGSNGSGSELPANGTPIVVSGLGSDVPPPTVRDNRPPPEVVNYVNNTARYINNAQFFEAAIFEGIVKPYRAGRIKPGVTFINIPPVSIPSSDITQIVPSGNLTTTNATGTPSATPSATTTPNPTATVSATSGANGGANGTAGANGANGTPGATVVANSPTPQATATPPATAAAGTTPSSNPSNIPPGARKIVVNGPNGPELWYQFDFGGSDVMNRMTLALGQVARILKDQPVPAGGYELNQVSLEYANDLSNMANSMDLFFQSGKVSYLDDLSSYYDKAVRDRDRWAAIVNNGYPFHIIL